MRFISSFFLACVLLLSLSLTGCSGGGGSSSSSNPTSNPVPSVTSMTPGSAQAGSAATVITVGGTDFIASSTVIWNESALATTYVSSTSLTPFG